MKSFPPEIDATTLFPTSSENLELDQLREYIAKYIKNISANSKSVRIPLPLLWAKSKLDKNDYKNLLMVHEELIGRNFAIQYEIVIRDNIGTIVKYVPFDKISSYGWLPEAMILSRKPELYKLVADTAATTTTTTTASRPEAVVSSETNNTFPNVADIFPDAIDQNVLSKIRNYIIDVLKKRKPDMKPVLIQYHHLTQIGMNYVYLRAIHNELMKKGFKVRYGMQPFLNSKGTKKFEELDEFGTAQLDMIIGSENTANF